MPAFTVRPRAAIAFFSAVPLAASTASAGFSRFGLLIEIDSIWIGLQIGKPRIGHVGADRRLEHALAVGGPVLIAARVAVDAGLRGQREAAAHRAVRELDLPFGHARVARAAAREEQECRPGAARPCTCASHPLPGCPFSGPASHSSSHSTRPLPQPSIRQLALQPSHELLLPSSHCSPGSSVPSPQAAVSPGHGGSVGSSVATGGGVTWSR